MKSIFLLIFTLFLCMQCNSQKMKKHFEESTSFENIQQMEGKWYNAVMKVQKKNVETNLKMDCQGKSFWEITKVNGKHNLSKHFATGKNCDIHTIKTNNLSYVNRNLNYTENDIIKSETIEKLSDKKFKITEKSFENGEPLLIEKIYEKR